MMRIPLGSYSYTRTTGIDNEVNIRTLFLERFVERFRRAMRASETGGGSKTFFGFPSIAFTSILDPRIIRTTTKKIHQEVGVIGIQHPVSRSLEHILTI